MLGRKMEGMKKLSYLIGVLRIAQVSILAKKRRPMVPVVVSVTCAYRGHFLASGMLTELGGKSIVSHWIQVSDPSFVSSDISSFSIS